ncbi:hypothetical protein J3B02_006031 [Coemansia erecta]|uniref:Uncharacterized protein n=1 Tax=Coemansia asiatica TaxID=1052880 RepID=A0A9W8CJA6_9FUNG|nr:hypothetical protein LPJ64_003702 [Coemansia asiatica]KAJ2841139.1 hypothetical protein J3B02_006031 [Coemansia erecta]KAJ2886991.1 hypothetical protein FB639_001465 [Coemansia asiatica]
MFSGSNKNNSGNVSGNTGTAAPQPQPIPKLAGQHSEQQHMQDPPEQTRRSSFAGWPQTLFGFSSTSKMPGASGFSPPTTSYSMAGANSLPDSTASAFSGMGLFRRFSTSSAGVAPPSNDASQALENPRSDYRWPAANSSNLDKALDSGNNGGYGKASSGANKEQRHHLQPKVFDEIRTHEDPPSRPDSRMRNLMLSGQFLI